jgi:hypothetical protein
LNSCAPQTETPLAGEGELSTPAWAGNDPYQALDDLMAVVETLCPVWPERDTFVDGGKMLL